MVTVMDFVSMVTESRGILVDTVALWLVQWTPDQVVWVQALIRAILLCFWTKHFIPTVHVPLNEWLTKCK